MDLIPKPSLPDIASPTSVKLKLIVLDLHAGLAWHMLDRVLNRVILELLVSSHAMAVSNVNLAWKAVVPCIHALRISSAHLVGRAKHPVLIGALPVAGVSSY
jgi:hypothetical protein